MRFITDNVSLWLKRLKPQFAEAEKKAIARAVLLVHRKSVKYAPISPTMAQKYRLRKTRRKVKRKALAYSRAKPGGLSRSIDWSAGATEGSIFVSRNSEAGKYAKRIHDEKYISWRNRGIGTIAKGRQADDKFIARALKDSEKAIDNIFRRAFKGIG